MRCRFTLFSSILLQMTLYFRFVLCILSDFYRLLWALSFAAFIAILQSVVVHFAASFSRLIRWPCAQINMSIGCFGQQMVGISFLVARFIPGWYCSFLLRCIFAIFCCFGHQTVVEHFCAVLLKTGWGVALSWLFRMFVFIVGVALVRACL